MTACQICEECTGEPPCSIAKRTPKEVQVPHETEQKNNARLLVAPAL